MTDTIPPLPELKLGATNRSIEHFMVRDSRGDLFDLEALYQRGSVWDEARQANLIRSLLMSLPVGSIIVSVLPWQQATNASWRVVDGKQRIEALRRFTSGDLAVPGAWFHGAQLNDESLRAGDVTWADLSDGGRRKFLNLPVSCLEFNGEDEMIRGVDGTWDHRKRTPGELLAAEAELFGLINGAGVDQTAEDMERAARIARGPVPTDHVGCAGPELCARPDCPNFAGR